VDIRVASYYTLFIIVSILFLNYLFKRFGVNSLVVYIRVNIIEIPVINSFLVRVFLIIILESLS
jgi:hypothetical protein